MSVRETEAPVEKDRFAHIVKMVEKTIGDNHAERGGGLFEEGDYEGAREAFNTALKIYRQARFPSGESRMLSLLALCSFALDEYGNSLSLLAQSVRLKGEIGDVEGGVTDLMAMGKVRLAMGDADTAVKSLIEARDLFERLEMHSERREVEELIRQAKSMKEAS